mgnify:CR=1 FL=1
MSLLNFEEYTETAIEQFPNLSVSDLKESYKIYKSYYTGQRLVIEEEILSNLKLEKDDTETWLLLKYKDKVVSKICMFDECK